MSIAVRLVQAITKRVTPLTPFTAIGAARYVRSGCFAKAEAKSSEIIAGTPCYQDVQNDIKPKAANKSMWENPECCHNPCPDLVPHMDDFFYKPSDKKTRKYTRTWAECPNILIRPRKVCCYENAMAPPFEKRPRKPRLKRCEGNPTDLMPCMNSKNPRCLKVLSPGCKGCRDPPKCHKRRDPAVCRKNCTPYPSFSECMRPNGRRLHPRECSCLDNKSMCEVWANWRRKMNWKK